MTVGFRRPCFAAAALCLAAPTAAAIAQTPAARGKVVYLQCRACHSLATGEAHKVGPNLRGIMGAKAGTRPGYAYSPALRRAGIRWSEATLDAFLRAPAATVKGTKMAYAGLARREDRAALIAYLKQAAP